MLVPVALPPSRPARAAARRIWRATALVLLAAAAALVALAWRGSADDGEGRIGPATRFDYVAVFPPGASPAQVEDWRSQVLRVHENACFRGFPCVARSLRGAELGRARQYAIGFDLMRETSPNERSALLAAAQQRLPGLRLVAASSLQQAVE